MEILQRHSPETHHLLQVLTPREQEVAELITTGATNKQIARHLGISVHTVKNMLTEIFAKTGTQSRTELAVWLVRLNYVRPVQRQARALPLGNTSAKKRA